MNDLGALVTFIITIKSNTLSLSTNTLIVLVLVLKNMLKII